MVPVIQVKVIYMGIESIMSWRAYSYHIPRKCFLWGWIRMLQVSMFVVVLGNFGPVVRNSMVVNGVGDLCSHIRGWQSNVLCHLIL